ncbi:MAG TPA: hypothetical protein VIN08_02645 [Ohtaekwangia sp.]|uniref:hypothetical protein n=1 Tax=Ohtaekwangia sp. TaxID=2066019 RepID=UPI002F930A28
MRAPLTRVLIRLMAIGFYRQHAGMLSFFFGTVLCYCFFITPAGHIPPGELITNNLTFTLAVLNAPIVMLVVLAAWLFYTIKSWQYIVRQLQASSQVFLYYSVTSFSQIRQMGSWCLVQLVILIPIILYGIMTLVVSIFYGQFHIPVLIFLYIAFLTIASASIYTYTMRNLGSAGRSITSVVVKSWPKPLFSLPVYELLHTQKLAWLITKGFSLAALLALFSFFPDIPMEGRSGVYIMMLMASVAHAGLIYQEHRFTENYMSLLRNFPYNRMRLYGEQMLRYAIILIPELLLLLALGSVNTALVLYFFSVGYLLLLASILYIPTINLRGYLWLTAILFTGYFIAVLFGGGWLLALLAIPASFSIYYSNYYRKGS